MVAVIHGSSFFRPIGNEAVTGPAGITGPTGGTGPMGHGASGPTGYSGGNLTNAYLINTDKLHQIFTWADGSTTDYTTSTKIQGPTGNSYIYIHGGNTYDILHGPDGGGGATVFKGRDADETANVIVLRTIEVTGDAITLTQNDELGTINIDYDRGRFGYINTTGGASGGCIVGTDASSNIVGFAGVSYDSSLNAVNTKVKSFKEKIRFLRTSTVPHEDIEVFSNQSTQDGQTPLYQGTINPNSAKVFVLELPTSAGVTGGLQVLLKDAKFGYTGNGPTTETNLSKAFTLIVKGATMDINNPAQGVRFTNTIWPFNKQPCWSGGTDIFNFFWMPCEPEDTDDDGVIDFCPNSGSWYGNIVQFFDGATDDDADPFWCNEFYAQSPLSFGNRHYRGSDQVDFPGIEILRSGATGATGACCIGDGNCVHTIQQLCPGYYLGAGVTCGTPLGVGTGVCLETGACCSYNTSTGEAECTIQTIDQCINLGEFNNIATTFGGTGSNCDNMNCFSAGKYIGACCDGRGGCLQLTNKECIRRGYYFQGVGIPCNTHYGTSAINVCNGGTGACVGVMELAKMV